MSIFQPAPFQDQRLWLMSDRELVLAQSRQAFRFMSDSSFQIRLYTPASQDDVMRMVCFVSLLSKRWMKQAKKQNPLTYKDRASIIQTMRFMHDYGYPVEGGSTFKDALTLPFCTRRINRVVAEAQRKFTDEEIAQYSVEALSQTA